MVVLLILFGFTSFIYPYHSGLLQFTGSGAIMWLFQFQWSNPWKIVKITQPHPNKIWQNSVLIPWNILLSTVTSHKCLGTSDHWQFNFFFYSLLKTKKKSKHHIAVPLWGESTSYWQSSNAESIFNTWSSSWSHVVVVMVVWNHSQLDCLINSLFG